MKQQFANLRNVPRVEWYEGVWGPREVKIQKLSRGVQNLEIIAPFSPNPTKICIHHLWVSGRVKIQKLTKGGTNKNIAPLVQLIQNL